MKLLFQTLIGVAALVGAVTTQAQGIYVTCSSSGSVEKFDLTGIQSTLATTSSIPWNTDPWGLTCDVNGNVYVSALQGQTVYKFNQAGTQSVFVAGIDRPSGIAFGPTGDLYVAKQHDHTVVSIDGSGNQSVFATTDGTPNWIAFDPSGNLFVTVITLTNSKISGFEIEKFDPAGNGSVFATMPFKIAGGFWGLACDRSGDLFAATYTDGTILKFDPSGNQTVFASNLNYPAGLTFDANDNLYATIAADGIIEKFDSSGNGSIFATGLNFPLGIAISTVPEPNSMLLLAYGAFGLALTRSHTLGKFKR